MIRTHTIHALTFAAIAWTISTPALAEPFDGPPLAPPQPAAEDAIQPSQQQETWNLPQPPQEYLPPPVPSEEYAPGPVQTRKFRPSPIQGQKFLPLPIQTQKGWPLQKSLFGKYPVQVGKAMCCPPTPRIRYRNHVLCRKACCKGTPAVPAVLQVNDPCTPCACAIAVPVCIPACCVGTPVVSARRGLLGRAIVSYTWCCGFEIRMVFRHRGDLLVHYLGR